MNLTRFAIQFAANDITVLTISNDIIHIQRERVSRKFSIRLHLFDQIVQFLFEASFSEFVRLVAAIIFLMRRKLNYWTIYSGSPKTTLTYHFNNWTLQGEFMMVGRKSPIHSEAQIQIGGDAQHE